ncbi:DEAD/DEAH box helicase [Fluviicola taffensis]|uniref:DEAD/DEAH box helicase domain protein n=1 Tax=Fluviicola taffensis (strain DSM 16823 / NCIMB 13979 / RW262) TaxID=755732 RepID=F2IAS1_FLUTR|nr:DEAD/DEAH box helicase [Fluviicola taffensis]AEA44226.1 DEAD/DEAH box helicase domain protein [Fluviicola taffensis DSM 16823]
MSFSSFGLSPFLLQALTEMTYEKPTPIQELAIPAILTGKDVLGIAPTGSGKTASYVLPVLAQLSKVEKAKNRHIQSLILVPTRELAIQVEEVFKSFAHKLPEPLKVKAVYGGVSINPQMKAMMGVSILIATPGRLIELAESNAIHLSTLKSLVLDEADKLLNLDFQEEMKRILSWIPKKRQNLLFSATLNDKVSEITQLILHEPIVLKIENEEDSVELIQQTAYRVSDERKGPLLRYLIRSRNMKQVLIFTSSTFKADQVVEKLRKNNIDAQAIHSKKSQDARNKVLRNFKAGHLKVLVATDLISRGIDIEFLPFVINYELPRSPKDYVHRIGRTGRAESTGEALTFVTPEDEHHFKIIQKKMGKQVPFEETDGLDLNA